jgi:long-chain acyl-CoA synthetase
MLPDMQALLEKMKQVRILVVGDIMLDRYLWGDADRLSPEAPVPVVKVTRETFTADGWLRTGDIGHLDADGFLVVTDRKKELLKTAAGKFVAPQPIENRLKSSPYVTNAMAVGERHKFVSVLLVPNFDAVAAKAREVGHELPSREDFAADPWVHDLFSRELDRLTKDLAQYERPKRFALIPEDFTVASGELTFTLKLKRRVIEQRYRDIIEGIYADVEEARPQQLS